MEEQLFSPLEETPFEEVLKALLDEDQVLDPVNLYRLSDINQGNMAALIRIWGDIQVERRRALIEDLEDLTDSNPLLTYEPIFRFAIKDEDDQVRFFATRAIEIFDTDDLIPFFLSVLDNEENENVRAVTTSVLGKYVYRGELEKIDPEIKSDIEIKLLEILNGDHPLEIQLRALEAISYSSLPEVRDHILSAYQSELEDWIASALFAMGRSFDHQYSELVFDKLQHTSPKVRLEAVRACGELTVEEAVPIILDLLDDLPEIRAAAIWALSQIGGEEAGPAIYGLLDDEVSDEEADLIQQALERLDFLEEGVNLSMFDMPYSEQDDYDPDEYDYDSDEFDQDGFELEDFDLDDDLWLE